MEVISQVLLPLILAFIMLTMGLSLTINDFKRVSSYPKAFLTGSFMQIIALPAFAFLIAYIWSNNTQVDPDLILGLILIAACPGGVTSNLLTHLGKGNAALSISLTAVTSVLSLITIPFLVTLAYTTFKGVEGNFSLPLGKTVLGIFLVTTVPVIIGMLIHAKYKAWSTKYEPKFQKIATLFFLIIVVSAVAKNWPILESSFTTVVPIVLLLNLGTMIMAITISKITKLSKQDSVALTFECGLQNGTLAIMIAITFLGSEIMMIPGGIYSLIMLTTGSIYVAYLRIFSK